MRKLTPLCSAISGCLGLLFGITASGQNPEAINPGTPWPATDALGRSLPLADEVGPLRSDRFVGIFYFLTHHRGEGRGTDGPRDVLQIMAKDPDALKKPDSPLWGPITSSHYWGEPVYGYYCSEDPWVLRRHAQLLADLNGSDPFDSKVVIVLHGDEIPFFAIKHLAKHRERHGFEASR